jgi:hypothetical protein
LETLPNKSFETWERSFRMIKDVSVKLLFVEDEPENAWILPSGFPGKELFVTESPIDGLSAKRISEEDAKKMISNFEKGRTSKNGQT